MTKFEIHFDITNRTVTEANAEAKLREQFVASEINVSDAIDHGMIGEIQTFTS